MPVIIIVDFYIILNYRVLLCRVLGVNVVKFMIVIKNNKSLFSNQSYFKLAKSVDIILYTKASTKPIKNNS